MRCSIGKTGIRCCQFYDLYAECLALPAYFGKVVEETTGSNMTPSSPQLSARLEKWRTKLLDLSLKNPLLSLRGNVGLSLWAPSPLQLLNALNGPEPFAVVPLPISEEGGVPGALAKVAPDYARKNGVTAATPLAPPPLPSVTSETHVTPVRRRLLLSEAPKEEVVYLEDYLSRHHPRSIAVDAATGLTEQLARLERINRQKEDETGVHVLFVAVGMVHWVDGKSTRTAPLLLVPVSLQRDHATDPFVLLRHPDDVVLNPALLHMLSQQYAIEWEDVEALMGQEKVDYKKIIATVQDKIKDVASVHMDVRLSLFSYAKHHMWSDLAARAPMLENHPVVQKIVGVPLTAPEPLFTTVEQEKLDEVYPPDRLLLPLPADASQVQAIARVQQGESLVIQGPPGTGKSQTITNVIANLLSDGKRVLFVAEKLTALRVVHERLEQLGLGAFCLELHTQSSSKQQVLTQLQEGLAVRNTMPVPNYHEAALSLQHLRTNLNESLDALHATHPNGLSIYRAIGQLSQHPSPLIVPGLVFPEVLNETLETVHQRKQDVLKYAQALRLKTPASSVFDAWRDLPMDDKHTWDKLNELMGLFQHLKQLLRQWPALAVSHPTFDLATVRHWLAAVAAWQEGSDIPVAWKRAVLNSPLEEAYAEFRAADKRWSTLWAPFQPHFLRSALNANDVWDEYAVVSSAWGPSRWLKTKAWLKKAKRHFNPSSPTVSDEVLERWSKERLAVSQAFDEVDQAAKRLKSLLPKDKTWDSAAGFSQQLKWVAQTVAWKETLDECVENATDCDVLKNALATAVDKEETFVPRMWLETSRFWESAQTVDHVLAVVSPIAQLLQQGWQGEVVYNWEEIPLDVWEAEVSRWLAAQASYSSWRTCERYRATAQQWKVGALLAAIEDGSCPWDKVEEALDCTYAQAFVNAARMEHPEFVPLQGVSREHAIEHFKKESSRFDALTRQHVVGQLAQRLRALPIDEWEDMVVLKRETMKKVRHLPTRKLIRKLPKLLPVIKPCLMMSPVSVAEYLSNEVPDFDVVIFDEASQITTADAIGAVSRAKQVVVVGDPKQMPPSRMFSVEEDDSEEGDLDSILTECLGSGMKSVLLNWHYRSRNERLIAFSNKTYYGGGLITFPSADITRPDQGLRVHEINGVYDRGGSGTNTDEAQAVVKALVEHISNPDCSQSIGVVTFNQKQQTLIEGLWDKALVETPDLEHWVSRLPQPLTIKNLESVQGDERDVILFSTTFGKDSDGRFLLNFGPLGQVGGERRLNVAITRARDKMEIFTSFHPNEIDPSRVTHQGVRDLREWLLFAKSGALAPSLSATTALPDSPFELAVMEALHARGWQVQPQVGYSGYRIDIGVIDPNNPLHYLAAIECDGATYHSFKAARDRDSQRQGVLEGLGWNIVRIWSTDWFEDSVREMERVHAQLNKLAKRD